MTNNLFAPLGENLAHDLERFIRITEETLPRSRRILAQLPDDIAELSRLLTSSRGSRHGSYLGKPAMLTAYISYFLPWNLYRLCHLLPGLPLSLANGDAITDLGSGPLTVPIALWLSRPELRDTNLEFRCLDRTGLALDTGARLFNALAGKSPWKIRCIKAPLGARIEGGGAALVTAANLYNEIIQDGDYDRSGRFDLRQFAEKQARFLAAISRDDGAILAAEPGVPRPAEFLSLLRSAFLELSRFPILPCAHSSLCPFSGARRGQRTETGKWCHFSFGTSSAPRELLRLSTAAGLPKERAVISFLYVAPDKAAPPANASGQIALRVISDAFPLASRGEYGRYCCSSLGMVLLAGRADYIEAQVSGTLLARPLPKAERRDPKSGALIM